VIPDPIDIVYCEVCELPHRRGAAVCEQCKHALGSTPNWERLRAELPELRNKVLVGVAATLLMIVGSGWLFGGGGYIVAMGPMTWAVATAFRWRVLAKRLAKRGGPPQPG
jgi:hypothetical protein